MDMLLARALAARRSHGRGRASSRRRAFLNDKLDLTQAEAIADLIDSGSVEAARAALRSMQGEFSVAVHSLTEAVTETRMHVEAAIDFPEEEIDFLADTALRARIDGAIELCAQITAKARQGALLREGMTVVIAGRPNAGKSSLLNRLAGYDAAIVTDDSRNDARCAARTHRTSTACRCTSPIRRVFATRPTSSKRKASGARTQEMTRADRILYVVDGQRGAEPSRRRARARDVCRRTFR